MKRLLMIVSIVALAVTGFMPAQADDSADEAPITAHCIGTANSEGSAWTFSTATAEANVGDIGITVAYGCPVVVNNQMSEPQPPPSNPLGIVHWLTETSPLGTRGNLRLDGIGDLECGNGTVASRSGADFSQFTALGASNPRFHIRDWSATFTDGVGELTGFGTPILGSGEPTHAVSATIVLDDATRICDQSDFDSVAAVQIELTPLESS